MFGKQNIVLLPSCRPCASQESAQLGRVSPLGQHSWFNCEMHNCNIVLLAAWVSCVKGWGANLNVLFTWCLEIYIYWHRHRNLSTVNSYPPGQNCRHFADDIFKRIFVNEMFCILIKNSLKFRPEVPFDNNPSLVKIMVWCRIGDKLLSALVLTPFTEPYMWH